MVARRSSQFKRDVKLAERRGLPMKKLRSLIEALMQGEALDPQFKDHPLRGRWQGYWEAHIAPDWLLVYAEGRSRLRHRGRQSGLSRGHERGGHAPARLRLGAHRHSAQRLQNPLRRRPNRNGSLRAAASRTSGPPGIECFAASVEASALGVIRPRRSSRQSTLK